MINKDIIFMSCNKDFIENLRYFFKVYKRVTDLQFWQATKVKLNKLATFLSFANKNSQFFMAHQEEGSDGYS